MLAEVLAVCALILVGGVVAVALGFRSVAELTVLSLPIGLAVLVAVGLVAGLTGISLSPAWLLSSCAVAVVPFLYRALTSRSLSVWPRLLAPVSLAAPGVAVLHGRGLVHVTPDSFWYLGIGSVMAHGGSFESISGPTLHRRGIAFPLVHSLGDLGSDYYLHAIGPLLTVTMLGALVWIGQRAVGPRLGVIGHLVPIAAAGFLVTNAGVLFHAFYINSHMLYAVWMLLVVGVLWLGAREALGSTQLWLAVVIVPALAILRPEAAVTTLLALVPAVTSSRLEPRLRGALLSAVGASTTAWHAYLLTVEGNADAVQIWGLFVVGLACIVLGVGIIARWIRLPTWFRYAVPTGLVLGLAALAVIEPDIFVPSLIATSTNMWVDGPYGSLLVILVGALTLAGLFRRVEHALFLAFTLITALPYGFVLAHLREGAFRVGTGDSFSRMMLHWIPIAVLLLVAHADSAPRVGTRQENTDGKRLPVRYVPIPAPENES